MVFLFYTETVALSITLHDVKRLLHLHYIYIQSFSRHFCPKRRTRERTFKLRAIKKPGVTINTTLHENQKNNNLEKRKKKCRNVTAEVQVKCQSGASQEGRCSLKQVTTCSMYAVTNQAMVSCELQDLHLDQMTYRNTTAPPSCLPCDVLCSRSSTAYV